MHSGRQFVTLEELSTLLTDELQLVEGAAGSRITVQYKLFTPDPDGCNWLDSVVVVTGPNASVEILRTHVQRLVQNARQGFNIK